MTTSTDFIVTALHYRKQVLVAQPIKLFFIRADVQIGLEFGNRKLESEANLLTATASSRFHNFSHWQDRVALLHCQLYRLIQQFRCATPRRRIGLHVMRIKDQPSTLLFILTKQI